MKKMFLVGIVALIGVAISCASNESTTAPAVPAKTYTFSVIGIDTGIVSSDIATGTGGDVINYAITNGGVDISVPGTLGAREIVIGVSDSKGNNLVTVSGTADPVQVWAGECKLASVDVVSRAGLGYVFTVTIDDNENIATQTGCGSLVPMKKTRDLSASFTGLAGASLFCTGTADGLAGWALGATATTMTAEPISQILYCGVRLTTAPAYMISLVGGTPTIAAGTSLMIGGYTFTSADISSANVLNNGLNFVLVVNPNGTITPGSALQLVSPPPPPAGTATYDIEIKSYAPFTVPPTANLSGSTGYAATAMTGVTTSDYTVTYANEPIPVDGVFTCNFGYTPAAVSGTSFLFVNNGVNMGYPSPIPFVVTVNGKQVSSVIGNDLKISVDPITGAVVVPTTNVTITYTPTAPLDSPPIAYFGTSGAFTNYEMTQSGASWSVTIPDVPYGTYEANVLFLNGMPQFAILPNSVQGTLVVDSLTPADKVVYTRMNGPNVQSVVAYALLNIGASGATNNCSGAGCPSTIPIQLP